MLPIRATSDWARRDDRPCTRADSGCGTITTLEFAFFRSEPAVNSLPVPSRKMKIVFKVAARWKIGRLGDRTGSGPGGRIAICVLPRSPMTRNSAGNGR